MFDSKMSYYHSANGIDWRPIDRSAAKALLSIATRVREHGVGQAGLVDNFPGERRYTLSNELGQLYIAHH